jgi:hypothetical protein
MALLVGQPAQGKSSLAGQIVRERVGAGRWVFVQDSNREFRHVFTGWASTAEWKRYAASGGAVDDGPAVAENAAHAQRVADDSASTLIYRGAAFDCPDGADELVDLALELGAAWNQQHGEVREPICILLNEPSQLDASGSTYLGKNLERLINQRRHLGVELILCLQRPTMMQTGVWAVVTDCYMFGLRRSDDRDKLERELGLPRGTLAELGTLPAHHYKHWRVGQGLL